MLEAQGGEGAGFTGLNQRKKIRDILGALVGVGSLGAGEEVSTDREGLLGLWDVNLLEAQFLAQGLGQAR